MTEIFTMFGVIMVYIVITILGGVLTTYCDESGESFFIGSYLIGAAIFMILAIIAVEKHYYGL